MLHVSTFFTLLKESFRDLLPIVLVILFFQGAIIESVPDNWASTSIGLLIVAVGLAVFLLGLEIGIFPVGEGLAVEFAKKGSIRWILIFAFLIGFGTTIAEPALVVIADKAAAISHGRIDADFLRGVVAFSVGFAITLGAWRIIKGHPIHYYIITGYILVVLTTLFSPHEIVGLAYDLGGVTTSTVTVPLVAALGIGLASSIKGRNPVLDGFGLIAFASLTPMIFVQLYGIYVYNFIDPIHISDIQTLIATNGEPEANAVMHFDLQGILLSLLNVIKDVLPILAIIFFFQYIILKKPVENLKEVMIGFVLVIVGLDAFIIGLEMGLFSLGETMAYELIQKAGPAIIYSFAFAIGFSTTMAEPSLTAIAKKAKEVSDGRINDFILRLFVALGVAIGIALGAFRIIHGGEIVYYISVGYIFVIALTFIAPKYIIPIAYDSGGVTTSTVTVPLVAAIGLGLATNTPGRDPLIDGFGLIAFASLFPMITVMVYGVIAQQMGIKGEHEQEERHVDEILYALQHATNNIHLNTVKIYDQHKIASLSTPFSALHLIIPKSKEEEAVEIALQSGASGVTIMEAKGFGAEESTHLYNRLHHENNNVNLMFIVPTKKIEYIIKSVIEKLDILQSNKGVIYSYPIEHLKGLSLKSGDLS